MVATLFFPHLQPQEEVEEHRHLQFLLQTLADPAAAVQTNPQQAQQVLQVKVLLVEMAVARMLQAAVAAVLVEWVQLRYRE